MLKKNRKVYRRKSLKTKTKEKCLAKKSTSVEKSVRHPLLRQRYSLAKKMMYGKRFGI